MDDLGIALVGGFLAVAQGVFGYFYARNYAEQRDFRRWVYEHIHDLDKRLTRNCALTEIIHDRVTRGE